MGHSRVSVEQLGHRFLPIVFSMEAFGYPLLSEGLYAIFIYYCSVIKSNVL